MTAMSKFNTIVLPGPQLPEQPWWPALHSMINTAFLQIENKAFPPSFTRLPTDPAIAAESLTKELGPNGLIVVMFDGGRPVASSGVLPFRGENWIKEVQRSDSSAEVTVGEATKPAMLYPQATINGKEIVDWELCCFCVDAAVRGQRLSRLLLDKVIDLIKPKGAKRVVANYAVEETGSFWPRLGFTEQIGSGSVLKKGFTPNPGMEGLRSDIHLNMLAKAIT